MGLAAGSPTPMVGLNQYALVAYIQDPLGSFLETVRREIVPGDSECAPTRHFDWYARHAGSSSSQASRNLEESPWSLDSSLLNSR